MCVCVFSLELVINKNKKNNNGREGRVGFNATTI